MIATTYISFLKTKQFKRWAEIQPLVTVRHVSVGMGEKILSPPLSLLNGIKEGRITWEEYSKAYLEHLNGMNQVQEMVKLAETAGIVVLVCYEKDYEHCHRYLLAKRIQE